MKDEISLFGAYKMRRVEKQEWWDFFKANFSKVFAKTAVFLYKDLLTEEENIAISALSKPFDSVFTYFYLVYEGDTCIGWTSGRQDHVDRLYMENTGILPDHQGRGIYTAMLPHLLEIARAAGFQRVYSRHTAVNNAVLVPKMKAGFLITSMELSEKYGLMIHLSYYFNKHRLNALRFRAGQDRLLPETASQFQVFEEE